MTRPPIKNEDIDDQDFEDNDEKSKPENICDGCDAYKSAYRKYCDSCIYLGKK